MANSRRGEAFPSARRPQDARRVNFMSPVGVGDSFDTAGSWATKAIDALRTGALAQ